MKKISTEILLEHCFKNKKSLTHSRALVIKTLSKNLKPTSAYELLEEINKNQKNKLNISTIYRVLEFWMKLGLIHKITTINKYLICLTPEAFLQLIGAFSSMFNSRSIIDGISLMNQESIGKKITMKYLML